MGNARRGVDAIKLASLHGNVNRLTEELRAHKKICADCSLHDNIARHSCARGWRLFKEHNRAVNSLAIYRGYSPDKAAGIQEVMF